MKAAEQKLLLDITAAVASVRDKGDLFEVIVEKIKPVFNPHGYAAVITTDEQKTYFTIFLSVLPGVNKEDLKARMKEKHPLDAPDMVTLDADEPLILQLPPVWEKYPDSMSMQVTKDLGIVEMMICPLWVSGKKIGSLHLHSLTEGQFNKEQFPLFKAVADIIAVAVSNILANEEAALRQYQNSVLIDIGASVASVRDKDDLFKVIVDKIKPVFIPSGHAAVITVDEDLTYHQIFLSLLPGMDEKTMRDFMKMKLPIDPVNRMMLDTDGPVILYIPPFWDQYPDVVGAQVTKALGIMEVMACPLWNGGKKIGSFHLLSLTAGHFNKEQFPLFKAVADIVAVAVSNILANESTESEQYYNKLFTGISASIATVKDREDLFKIIFEKITPVFNQPPHAVILPIDEDEKYYHMMFGEVAGLTPEEIEFYKTSRFDILPPLRMILDAQEGVIIQTAPLVKKYQDTKAAAFNVKLGVQEIIGCRLQVSGKTLGAFLLMAHNENYFQNEQLPLFKAICDIVAVAVANIIAGDKVKLREHQQSQLLKISEHIAGVRDKNDLFQMVAERIKSFIPYDDFVIATVNEENQTFGVLLSGMDEITQNHESYKPSTTQVHPLVKGTIPYKVYSTEKPFIIDIIYEYEKDRSDYFRYAYELGMKQELVARLVHSGKVIGLVAILSRDYRYAETDIETLYSLSSLLAIALYNILANEELILREYHKTQLYNISKNIANVRDKDDLFKLIAKDIKSFVQFDDAVVALFNYENNTASIFLAAPTGTTSEHPDYEKVKKALFPVQNDRLLHAVTKSEHPIIIDIEKMHLANPSLPFMQYAYNFGMKETIAAKLTHSNNVIGIFSVLSKQAHRYTKEDVNAIQSLSNLVSIALNNILSNEELKLREQQTLRLYNISANIATIRDRDDLFRLIARDMKAFIDFDDVEIAVINEEKQSFDFFLSGLSHTKVSREKQAAALQSYPIEKENPFFKQEAFPQDKPFINDIEAAHLKYPDIDSIRHVYELGMKEEILAKLFYSDKMIGVMTVLSKKRKRFTQKDVDTVHSLTSLVAIALNNILANEELKRREEQKSRLLNISTHIAHIRDKNDLFHLITEDLKGFIKFDHSSISLFNENSTSFSIFLADVGADVSSQKDFDKAATQIFPVTKNSPPYQVIHSETALIFDIKKEHFKNPELDYLRYAYQFGMREQMIIRLSHSGKVIGGIALVSNQQGHFTEADKKALHSLSSLIAIALNNILANEKIENLSKQLELDNTYLNEEIKSSYNFEEIIGVSKPLQEVFKKVTQVAQADSTVLITGETGTGKELIARAIHNLSPRKARPLIKVNCAALPATLIESELFGHEKGSFTGATDKRLGKFELANGSTIFLDEVGELPLELQAKLLRAIQEKEIERLGGDKIINVDVRIITATNRNLEKEVSDGKFRQDLFYRLNVYPIELPALRERKEDIPLLAAHFIQKFSKKLGKKITGIAPSAMEELIGSNWPGNIRELEHTMERTMLLTSGKIITDLNISKADLIPAQIAISNVFTPKSLAENEKELIIQTLKLTNGRIRGKGCAAELLQILPTTLEARMKKLGIKKEFVKE